MPSTPPDNGRPDDEDAAPSAAGRPAPTAVAAGPDVEVSVRPAPAPSLPGEPTLAVVRDGVRPPSTADVPEQVEVATPETAAARVVGSPPGEATAPAPVLTDPTTAPAPAPATAPAVNRLVGVPAAWQTVTTEVEAPADAADLEPDATAESQAPESQEPESQEPESQEPESQEPEEQGSEEQGSEPGEPEAQGLGTPPVERAVAEETVAGGPVAGEPVPGGPVAGEPVAAEPAAEIPAGGAPSEDDTTVEAGSGSPVTAEPPQDPSGSPEPTATLLPPGPAATLLPPHPASASPASEEDHGDRRRQDRRREDRERAHQRLLEQVHARQRSGRRVRRYGVLVVLAGTVLALVGTAGYLLARDDLLDQRITVSAAADRFAGEEVSGPLTAWAQLQQIDRETTLAGQGRSYAELPPDDPRRMAMISASFQRPALVTALVTFATTLALACVGVVLMLIGAGLLALARGLRESLDLAAGQGRHAQPSVEFVP